MKTTRQLLKTARPRIALSATIALFTLSALFPRVALAGGAPGGTTSSVSNGTAGACNCEMDFTPESGSPTVGECIIINLQGQSGNVNPAGSCTIPAGGLLHLDTLNATLPASSPNNYVAMQECLNLAHECASSSSVGLSFDLKTNNPGTWVVSLAPSAITYVVH